MRQNGSLAEQKQVSKDAFPVASACVSCLAPDGLGASLCELQKATNPHPISVGKL